MSSIFSWTTADGDVVDVEAILDVDSWTGRELRAAEKLMGGQIGGVGYYGTVSIAAAIGIARTVPGYTVESADAQITLGKVKAIVAEMRARDQADAEAKAAGAAADEPVQGDVVLSPTKPAEPGNTQEPPTRP